LFARPAAVSVRNAQMLADLQRTVEQLRTALASRAGIDQAVGLLMSRSGLTAAEAFQRLREMSQRSHVRVGVIAQQLLDEAVTRARVRRSGDDATERVEQPRAGDRR
jgi:AmiR/NasT family two-component response regulator